MSSLSVQNKTIFTKPTPFRPLADPSQKKISKIGRQVGGSPSSNFSKFVPQYGPTPKPKSLLKRVTVGCADNYEEFMKINRAKYKAAIDELEPGSPLKDANGKPCQGFFGTLLTSKKHPDIVLKLQRPDIYEKNPTVKEKYAAMIRQEANFLEMLTQEGCPHVIRFVQKINSLDNIFVIATTKAARNLHQLYGANQDDEKRRVKMDDIEIILKSVLEALVFMHTPTEKRLPILHGDLKPENITYNPNTKDVKILDFGLAKFVPRHLAEGHEIYTPWYRSPEVALGYRYGTGADIWALGCIAAELLSGEPLFPAEEATSLADDTLNLLHAYRDRFEDFPAVWIQNSPILKNKVPPVLARRTAGEGGLESWRDLMRWAFSQVRAEEGFNQTRFMQLIELMQDMLHLDPNQRITAEKALQHPFFTKDFSTDLCFKIKMITTKTKTIRVYSQEGDLLRQIKAQDCYPGNCFHVKKLEQYQIVKLNAEERAIKLNNVLLTNGMVIRFGTKKELQEEGKQD